MGAKMSDEVNNNDPLNEEPGWAALDGEQAQPTPPPSPTPVGPDAFPAIDSSLNQNTAPAGVPYGEPKKKSKLWLWITLSIVVPLMLCGIGAVACTTLIVSTTKPAVDATNNFYHAAQDGEDLDSLTCKRFLDEGGTFNGLFQESENNDRGIKSFDFKDVQVSNGEAEVTGTVKRENGTTYKTVVNLDKENGKFKVCTIRES